MVREKTIEESPTNFPILEQKKKEEKLMKRKARSLFGAVKVCDITNHRIKWRKTLPHWRSTLLEPRKEFFCI